MNKRIVKSPKLYFYDTGLLSHLLGIKSSSALQKHTAYGSIFENWIITEIRKNNFNSGLSEGMYYFRDNVGNEIDLITERDGEPMAIEIKAGTKADNNMLRGLKYWQKLQPKSNCILINCGNKQISITETLNVLPWTEVINL